MTTVIYGDFEWDADKAAANSQKHGVTFEEAATAVIDEDAVFVADDSSEDEERYRVIGMSRVAQILLVAIVQRGHRDRIITARRATVVEERIYAEGK